MRFENCENGVRVLFVRTKMGSEYFLCENGVRVLFVRENVL